MIDELKIWNAFAAETHDSARKDTSGDLVPTSNVSLLDTDDVGASQTLKSHSAVPRASESIASAFGPAVQFSRSTVVTSRSASNCGREKRLKLVKFPIDQQMKHFRNGNKQRQRHPF